MICVLKDFWDGWNVWSKEKWVLMAHHRFTHSCKKQGNSCQKHGSFHSFKNVENESLSQFTWSCEILAWLCETNKDSYKNFNPLDHFTSSCEHFTWLCEIHLKDYNKMSPLDHFAHLCKNFACLCQFFLYKNQKNKKQICSQYKRYFISHH